MVRAMVSHSFRAITFRHDGSGVDNVTWRVILSCIAVSMAMAYARWGIPLHATAHGVVILAMAAWVSPRLAVVYSLLSAGIDAAAIPLESLHGGELRLFFWWEIMAALYLVFRMHKQGRLARGGQ